MITTVGLDLSLTMTGVAKRSSDGSYATDRIKGIDAKRYGELRRLRSISSRITEVIDANTDDLKLIVLEAPSLGHGRQMAGKFHERAGLWWMVVSQIMDILRVPIATVPPATLKMFATGSGRAEKSDMMGAAVAVWEDFYGDDNQCDALWLAEMGMCHLGESPLLAKLTAKQRKALNSATWNIVGEELT